MSINTKPATPWSLEALPPEEVDIRKLKRYQLRRRTPRADHVPVHNPRRGMITEQTPVASIGSCFADEILSWLHLNGYNIVRTEATGRAETDSATVQSARFGQVLNTHAMRQVLERAIGLFEPEEWCWPDRSGKLLDPYRKLVTWDSEEEAKADLE
ncbi:MAG: GSCFA domain-containing protein, partial [Planctomycetota bacterium]